jgi:hypothetical protein
LYSSEVFLLDITRVCTSMLYWNNTKEKTPLFKSTGTSWKTNIAGTTFRSQMNLTVNLKTHVICTGDLKRTPCDLSPIKTQTKLPSSHLSSSYLKPLALFRLSNATRRSKLCSPNFMLALTSASFTSRKSSLIKVFFLTSEMQVLQAAISEQLLKSALRTS